MKFMHGVKLVTCEAVQGVLIWAWTEINEQVTTNTAAVIATIGRKPLRPSMKFFLWKDEQMVFKERVEMEI